MHHFTDNTGATWNLELTISISNRVLKPMGLNLIDFPACIEKLSAATQNVSTCMDIIWKLLAPQIREHAAEFEQMRQKISEETGEDWTIEDVFWDRLTSEQLRLACDALGSEIVFFTLTLHPKGKAVLEAVERKADKILDLQLTKILEFCESPDMEKAMGEKIDKAMAEKLAEFRGDSKRPSMRLPGSSGSTPAL